jgi:hypothetical protein
LEKTRPRFHFLITYAWADYEEDDFYFLVQELQAGGVEVSYEKIALLPPYHLWDQIANRITDHSTNGWGYLVSPRSLMSDVCRGDLAEAARQALIVRGRSFPLIGMLYKVKAFDVPPALTPSLCVDLSSPAWVQEVKARLEGKPVEKSSVPQTRYVWRVYAGYLGQSSLTAVEIRPRAGEIAFWQVAVPATTKVTQWGCGPTGCGTISEPVNKTIQGRQAEINGVPVAWYGAGDQLSEEVSAYFVFEGDTPGFLCFGFASNQSGKPHAIEVFRLR